MKKIIAILLLVAGTSAMAQPHRYGPVHRHWYPNHSWVFPTVIGGVVGYEIARQQQPVIVQQSPPVVIQQSPVNCSAWKEIQQSDGTIVRERICTQ